MAYASFRLGGGLNLKAAADAIPDDALTVCRHCSFDTVGALTSGKGRDRLNSGGALGGSGDVLGGFDGPTNDVKTRFFKRGANVYYGTVADGANVSSTYADSVGALALPFPLAGATETFGTTGRLTGFCHNGYAYMTDGSGMGRWNGGVGVTQMESWGLRSPGYHTFDGARANPLTTTLDSSDPVLVTVDVDGGHGLGDGIGTSTYPFNMSIELVGLQAIGGAKSNDINCLHSGYNPSSDSHIIVTTSGGILDPDTDAATYTLEFVNEMGGRNMSRTDFLRPSQPGHNYLSGGTFTITTTQAGGDGVNEKQTFSFTGGTGMAGWFRLRVATGDGTNETTGDIEWNATHTTWQTILNSLEMLGGSQQAATTVCAVTSATEFTFTLPAGTDTTAATGGGDDGFMRQGPTLAVGSATGNLINGTYYYAYTFYNGVAESNFSAQVPIIVSTGNSVDLSNVMIGPGGTTERRIYRSDVNARQMYYIGKIEDNSSTTFTDLAGRPPGADPDADQGDSVTDQEHPSDELDVLGGARRAVRRALRREQEARAAADKKRESLPTNLGLLSDWTDHDPPPAALKHVGMVGETCFGIDGADIVFSASGNVEHWPLSNRFTPNKNSSSELMSWMKFDRDVIVYTTSSVHRFSAIGLDFSDARLEEVESSVGLAGEFACAALDGMAGHLMLTKAGIYLFDGARTQEVSFPVEPLFTDPNHADYITPEFMSQAVMVTSRDRMWLSYRTGTAGVAGDNNRTLFADFQDMQKPAFAVLDWGFTRLWREEADNYVIGGDEDGFLYLLDVGWNDDGSVIAWDWETKRFKLGGDQAFMLDDVYLEADLAGISTTVTVTAWQRDTTKTCTFTLSSTGRQRHGMKVPTWMRGESVSVAATSSGALERTAYNLGFTFMPMGEP